MAEFLIEKKADENWVVSPDGTVIYVACNDGHVRTYDALTGELLDQLFIGGNLDGIALSPDGQNLVVTLADLVDPMGDGGNFSATAQFAFISLDGNYFEIRDIPVTGDDRGIADVTISETYEILFSLHSVSGTSSSLVSYDMRTGIVSDRGDVAGDGTALSLTSSGDWGMTLVGEVDQPYSEFQLMLTDGFVLSNSDTYAYGEVDFVNGVEAVSGNDYDGFIAIFTNGELKVFDKEFYPLATLTAYDGISGDIVALAFGADGSTLYALDARTGLIDSYSIAIGEFGPEIAQGPSTALNEITVANLPYGAEMVISPDGGTALINTPYGILAVELAGGGGGGDPADNDVLFGTDGNDVLDGGVGADEMYGGLGDDTYYVDNAGDLVIEDAGPGSGTDTVITTLGTYSLPENVENLEIAGDAGEWTLEGNALDNEIILPFMYAQGYYSLTADGLGGADTIDASALQSYSNDYPTWSVTLRGGEGDDWLIGSSGADNELYGDTGADTLVASGSGYNSLDGGEGADILDASAASGYVYFYVDDENDVVIVGSGTDYWSGTPTNYLFTSASYFVIPEGIFDVTFQGYGFTQTVIGSDGVNHFRQLDALDTAAGGGGNDYYYLDSDQATVIEDEDGGYDRVSLFRTSDYTMPLNVEEATIFTASSTLRGNVQDNVLAGSYGTLIGGLGNDTYRIGTASVIVEEADGGIDTVQVNFSYTLATHFENLSYRDFNYANGQSLTGNAVDNVITGSNGNETLRGLDGDDTLIADVVGGGTGSSYHQNDTLYGGNGNDTLYAVFGNDTLYAEAGWDTLYSGNGNDRLDGGNGRDTASYANAAAGVTVSLAIAGAQDTGGAGVDTLVAIEQLVGSAFDDTLLAGVDATMLWGGAGHDTIVGGAGSDYLFGEDGNDTIDGSEGWDQLHGGDGDDVMSGGNGGDLFRGGLGNDTIYGGAGTDRAYLDDGDDTAWGGDDNDLLNGQSGADSLHGENGDDELVGAAGNDRLDGGAGDDLLNGGGHDDVLIGGEGNDVLLGSWGVDVLTGGAGADNFVFETGHSGRWRGNADTITDFSQADGDVIDLSAIDAIAGGDNDAFTFIGNAAFSGTAGELAVFEEDGNTYIAGDVNGDGVEDFLIRLEGLVDLTAGDFVL